MRQPSRVQKLHLTFLHDWPQCRHCAFQLVKVSRRRHGEDGALSTDLRTQQTALITGDVAKRPALQRLRFQASLCTLEVKIASCHTARAAPTRTYTLRMRYVCPNFSHSRNELLASEHVEVGEPISWNTIKADRLSHRASIGTYCSSAHRIRWGSLVRNRTRNLSPHIYKSNTMAHCHIGLDIVSLLGHVPTPYLISFTKLNAVVRLYIGAIGDIAVVEGSRIHYAPRFRILIRIPAEVMAPLGLIREYGTGRENPWIVPFPARQPFAAGIGCALVVFTVAFDAADIFGWSFANVWQTGTA